MPAAVTAAVSAVGAAIGGTGGAFLIMNATAVASAALVATSLSVGNYQRRKAKQAARAAFNAGLEDRLVMVSTATGARSRCYGRVRNVDGVLFKGTRGTNNEFYTLFIAVAGHEIDGFEDVYFGDIKVTLDGNGYVQTAPFAIERRTSQTAGITLSTGSPGGTGTATITGTYVAGSASAVQPATESTDEKELSVSVVGSTITVSGGTAGAAAIVNWQTSSFDSKARVRFYTGGLNQDLSVVLDPLFPSLIDSTHKFAGIAGLLVDLEYDPDAWPSGVPSISAVFRGARVEDPRASPSLVWTENPALIARDWALYKYGGGAAVTDIDEQSFEDAANACDVTHGFVTPSGTTTLPLYTCGIVCKTDVDPYDQFLEIVESMAGKAGWAGGQLRVVAGEYRSPVATITEDWISDSGEIQIVAEPPTEDAVNVYRGTISDKDQDYVVVQAPEVRSSTYITADGRELPREVALAGVTDTIHAQHVMGVMMRDARNGLTCVLPCNMRAFQVELFDVVSVTLPRFGWTAKTFEVIDWSFSPEGGVVLTLKETAAAIFQPDAGFAELDLTPNTELPDPAFAPIPTGVTVSTSVPELVDGQPVVRALVEWDALADAAVLQGGSIEIQYLEIGSNYGWLSVKVAGDQTEHVLPVLQAGSSYLFRTRSINAIGVHSDWSVQTVIVTSAAPKIQASGLAVGAVSARVEAEKAVTLTAFAAGIEPVTVVAGSTLPTTKSTETIVLTGTGKLYRWTGSAYTAAVPTSDLSGTISEAQIAANAVSVAKFASGIEPVTVVSSVPGSLSTRSIFNTSDGKLYRWNGSAYVATVPTTDLTGTVSDAQIAGMAASKVTGQLSDSQLAAIAAAKVTGTLTASQLAVSIGGGNLVPNANFRKHAGGLPYGWGEYNNGGTARTFQVASGGLFGTNFVRVTADAATTNTLGISTQTGVAGGGVQAWQPGLTYIVSFYARSAGSLAAGQKMQGLYSNMGFPSATELANPALINGVWQRYVWRVSPADNVHTPSGELYLSWDLSGGTLPAGAAIDICAVQVEQGDMVTAFAPKPSEILPDTITVTEIADNAITTPKLIAGAVVAGKIAANAVSATEIAAGAVTTAKLAAGAVTANEIAANTITAAKIATGTITATELAAGSVTTAKIAAGAVTANEIAAATITGGKIAAGTITGSNIAADTITAGQIATGAITADEIAANAIRTDKLLVTGRGDALNEDPNTQDVTAWQGSGLSIVSGNSLGAPNGRSVLRCSSNSGVLSQPVALDLSKNYQLRLWIRQQSGATTTYLTVAFNDQDNANISGGADGWPGTGTYFYFGLINQTPSGAWTEYRISFGPGETAKIPAGAKTVQVGLLANHSGGAGAQDVTGVRLMLKADADLVVDGAITTDKLAANAVTAAKITAGAVTTAKLAAGAVTANEIAANTITAAKIAAGAIGADQIAADAVTADKIDVTNLAAVNAQTGALTVDGTLTVGTGGKVQSGKTAYGSGTGWLIEHNGGTPRFDVGDGTKYIRWTGSNLEIGGQVISNSNLAGSISADKLSLGTITVSFTPSSVNETVYGSGETLYTSVTASASGGTSPYTYRFSIQSYTADYSGATRPYAYIDSVTTGDTVNPKGAQPNNSLQTFEVVCIATDANGRTGTGTCAYNVTYGTPP